jgi:hypothetical protein
MNQLKKDNPLTSYLRHALVVILMQMTSGKLPAEGLPVAVEYAADAVVLAVYWLVVKYGVAICRNRVLPWLDKLAKAAEPK